VGGPRFNESLTTEQRSALSNGIWLCQSCSKLIDSDVAKFTVEVLNEWKAIAEHYAESENQGFQTSGDVGASIFVDVDNWETWVDSGTQSSPGIFVISYFSAGDVVYSCRLRFQNRSKSDHLLTKPRVDLEAGGSIIESVDANVVSMDDIELPVDRWVSISIHNGFDGSKNFNRADSVWFRCELVGQEFGLSVRLANLK
jgi:hypothetical protein